MVRYGRDNLGFVWVVLEPLILSAGVLVLWSYLRGTYEHGIALLEFVFTGYMLLTLWRHQINSMTQLLRRSAHLLYHAKVTVFDIFFARAIVEFLGVTGALILVFATLSLAGLIGPIEDWFRFISGWLLMGGLATGFGSLVLVLTELSEASEKLIQPIQYFLLPLGGTFYMVDWLPPRIQDWALLNPTVHCYEMFRAGVLGDSVTTHYSLLYPLIWIACANLMGFWGIARVRSRIQVA